MEVQIGSAVAPGSWAVFVIATDRYLRPTSSATSPPAPTSRRSLPSALLAAAGVTPSARASALKFGKRLSSINRCHLRARAPTGFARVFEAGGGFGFERSTGLRFLGARCSGRASPTSYCGSVWPCELLASQARDTNSASAQMDLGPEDIVLLISCDPEKTALRLAEVKARREADAKKKVAADAARLLKSANARFRKAETTTDPTEAARLRLEGEERPKDLAKVDPAAWPWAEWMYAVREHELLVPPDGQAPVWEGLRIGIPSKWNPERVEFAEFGKVRGTTIAAREAGSATWNEQNVEQVAALGIEPGHLAPTWPEDDDPKTEKALETLLRGEFRRWGNWPALKWSMAPDAWVEKWWPRVESLVVLPLASVSPYYADEQRVPIVVAGKLVIAKARGLMDGKVIEPTGAGWQDFLARAPASGLKWGELAEAGEWWWGRKIPRDLLSAAREQDEREAA